MSRVPSRAPLVVADAVASLLTAAAIVVAETGGFTLQAGATRVGVHGGGRLALLAVAAFAVGTWLERPRASASGGAAPLDRRLASVTLAGLAAASIGYWLSYLSTVSGGADSYGYVSASELLRQARLVEPQPLAAWLPVGDPLGVTTQLAYVPAPDGSGSVPGYPLGFPVLIAVATSLIGALGPYVVPPIGGLVCLVTAWRLGTRW